ncbi:hypothetical protein B0A52_06460 [Exophiala mesophila]|uniref:BZIP domain-containing protein n=1 Tax=Exophiala mesophila TaxID=212818 RepID=A0A438N272_EXOME|nr:hypothetical protein B0A52_06460 [Exophiala mesophila]
MALTNPGETSGAGRTGTPTSKPTTSKTKTKTNDTSTGPKKPYVRRITEQRREQNRRSQKVYREKLRKRLEELEQQAGVSSSTTTNTNTNTNTDTTTTPESASASASASASVATGRSGVVQQSSLTLSTSNYVSESVPVPVTGGERRSLIGSTSASAVGAGPSVINHQDPISHPLQSDPNPPVQFLNLGDAFAAAGDLPIGDAPMGVNLFLGQSAGPQFDSSDDDDDDDGKTLLGIQRHTQSQSNIEYTQDDYGDMDLRGIWALPSRPRPQPQPQHSSNQLNRNGISIPHSSPPWSSPWTVGPTNHNLAVIPRQRPRQRPRTQSRQQQKHHHDHQTWQRNQHQQRQIQYLQTRTGPMTLSSPQMNHLRINSLNLIEASISIGAVMGISRSAYLNDHPSQLPGCYVYLNGVTTNPSSTTTTISPLRTSLYVFSPTQSLSVTPELYAHIAHTIKSSSSLRPSPAQLTTPHPAYLDCIIFPHMRDAAVRASAEGILDHVSLFTDLLNGGLVCWGGGSDSLGLSRRRRMRDRSMADGVAWSTRSWEARPWFLRKWSWLIGSEEEERSRGDSEGVWAGSRWWRGMRGEDSEEEDDYDEEEGGKGDERFDGERVQEEEEVEEFGNFAGKVDGGAGGPFDLDTSDFDEEENSTTSSFDPNLVPCPFGPID